MMRIYTLIKKNILFLSLFAFSLLILLVTVKMNLFRYNNFDFGKFDLGNMTQMVWYTAYGNKFLWLTDYFGTNLPRWAMSHVDPILVLFVPIFMLFPHPLTLVYSQLVLVIFSALILFKIAELELESKFSALFIGLSFLFYPAVGFLLSWTGFHGVTAILPFFFGAFYVFERMYKNNNFTKKGLVLFWLLLILTMMGKEQIPLIIALYGAFIWLFRKKKKLGVSLVVVGVLWFLLAFLVIIPNFAHYRIEGYQKFAQELSIGSGGVTDVALPNFFLSRYAEFGDSYSEVIKNMIFNPKLVIRVFLGGDNLENLANTFYPLALFPLLYLPLVALSVPDILINYLTTAGGIGTAEVINHRVSMIIPGLFLSTIYGISFVSRGMRNKFHLSYKSATIALSSVILFSNIYASVNQQNPVYLWLGQAFEKRIVSKVFAKTADRDIYKSSLEIGDRVKLTPLESKDRECARKIVEIIPDEASVTGPDYLGAHLSQRETYGIFPSLHTSADYVIVDVFAQKVLRILNVDESLINEVVGDMVKNPDYKLDMACGNLFVFKNIGPHGKSLLLPLQEKFEFDEKMDLEIFQSLTIVDYSFPKILIRGESSAANLVYVKRENNTLDGYFLFTSFVNKDTGELYQIANLPAFGLEKVKDWREDRYYLEDIELVIPEHINPGQYQAFIGMYNRIRTRSIYLGDVSIQ